MAKKSGLSRVKADKGLDPNKIQDCLDNVLKTLNKKKLTVQELIIMYGNLGYAIGASMGGYKGKGPGLEELKQQYYSEPSLANAMMLNGLTVTSWHSSIPKVTP